MLTIKQLRDDREAAIRRLAKKEVDAAPVIAEIEKLTTAARRSSTNWTNVWPHRTRRPNRSVH